MHIPPRIVTQGKLLKVTINGKQMKVTKKQLSHPQDDLKVERAYSTARTMSHSGQTLEARASFFSLQYCLLMGYLSVSGD